jgi:hypothetical protein
MDKRTKGLIATIAAVVLCGCPGLVLCLIGVLTAFGGGTFDLSDLGGGTGATPPAYGYVMICTALIGIIIPIVIGIVTLRKPAVHVDNSGPMPPAS